MKKLLEFKCGGKIGADPDVAANVVWYLLKRGPDLCITEVRISLRSIFVEVEVPEGNMNEREYLQAVGSQLQAAIAEGARAGALRMQVAAPPEETTDG